MRMSKNISMGTSMGMRGWWRRNCRGQVYFCQKCNKKHWKTSSIGKAHNPEGVKKND